MVLINGIINRFFLVFKMHIISLIFYLVSIIGMCVFVVAANVQ